MRQKITIAGLVVLASLIAGLLMYCGVRVMYSLAAALSLSPALTNLVPLVAVGVLWFIVSRTMKYFRRRAENRSALSALGAGSPPRVEDEERRRAWLQIKAKGKKQYVWRVGVIGWGLPVFAIFTPIMIIFGPRMHQLSRAEIGGITVVSLLVWLVSGYFFGLSTWKSSCKKYR